MADAIGGDLMYIHALKYDIDEATNKACFYVDEIPEQDASLPESTKNKNFLWQSQKWFVTIYDESTLPYYKGKPIIKRTIRRRQKRDNEGNIFEVSEVMSSSTNRAEKGGRRLREIIWTPKDVNIKENYILLVFTEEETIDSIISKSSLANSFTASYAASQSVHDGFEITYDEDNDVTDIDAVEQPTGGLARLTYISEKILHVAEVESQDDSQTFSVSPMNIRLQYEEPTIWVDQYNGHYGMETSHVQVSERHGESLESSVLEIKTRGGYLSDFSFSLSDIRRIKRFRKRDTFERPTYSDIPSDVVVIDELRRKQRNFSSSVSVVQHSEVNEEDEEFEDLSVEVVSMTSHAKKQSDEKPPSIYGSNDIQTSTPTLLSASKDKSHQGILEEETLFPENLPPHKAVIEVNDMKVSQNNIDEEKASSKEVKATMKPSKVNIYNNSQPITADVSDSGYDDSDNSPNQLHHDKRHSYDFDSDADDLTEIKHTISENSREQVKYHQLDEEETYIKLPADENIKPKQKASSADSNVPVSTLSIEVIPYSILPTEVTKNKKTARRPPITVEENDIVAAFSKVPTDVDFNELTKEDANSELPEELKDLQELNNASSKEFEVALNDEEVLPKPFKNENKKKNDIPSDGISTAKELQPLRIDASIIIQDVNIDARKPKSESVQKDIIQEDDILQITKPLDIIIHDDDNASDSSIIIQDVNNDTRKPKSESVQKDVIQEDDILQITKPLDIIIHDDADASDYIYSNYISQEHANLQSSGNDTTIVKTATSPSIRQNKFNDNIFNAKPQDEQDEPTHDTSSEINSDANHEKDDHSTRRASSSISLRTTPKRSSNDLTPKKAAYETENFLDDGEAENYTEEQSTPDVERKDKSKRKSIASKTKKFILKKIRPKTEKNLSPSDAQILDNADDMQPSDKNNRKSSFKKVTESLKLRSKKKDKIDTETASTKKSRDGFIGFEKLKSDDNDGVSTVPSILDRLQQFSQYREQEPIDQETKTSFRRSRSFDSLLCNENKFPFDIQESDSEIRERRRRLAGYSYVGATYIPSFVIKSRDYSMEACALEMEREINFVRQERKKFLNSKASKSMDLLDISSQSSPVSSSNRPNEKERELNQIRVERNKKLSKYSQSMDVSLDVVSKVKDVKPVQIPGVFLNANPAETNRKKEKVGRITIPSAFSMSDLLDR